MKVYISVDLECVAGVVSHPEYCLPGRVNKENRRGEGKYYEHARQLATMEANAAVEGLLESGAHEILLVEGHGPGALNASLIHREARVLTGKGLKYPSALDESFDAAIRLGQHAKVDTDGGHLCHSGSLSRADWLLNGKSLGEIGFFMLRASYFNVPVIMVSGDAAACAEARKLVPSIETVCVIEGLKRGSTKGMTTNEALDLNVPAIHVSPLKARQMIKQGVKRALGKVNSVERFWMEPPYEMVRITRPDENKPPRRAVNRGDDLIELSNQSPEYQLLDEVQGTTKKKR